MRAYLFYLGVAVMMAVGFAQGEDKLPEFDVASVKPAAHANNASPQAPTPGRLTMIGIPMQALIQYAFRAPRYRISGGPKWLESERYDIVATMPANTVTARRRLMMRALLRDRFHLVTHLEKKVTPVYVLMRSASGPKFQVEKREKTDADGRIGGGGPGRVGGIKVSAFDLAEVLCDYLDRPVLDRTGIDGLFDFKLIWTPDESPRELNPAEQRAPADPNGASIFTATQQQLGLRLVRQEGSIDLLVIDHVDRTPSEN